MLVFAKRIAMLIDGGTPKNRIHLQRVAPGMVELEPQCTGAAGTGRIDVIAVIFTR
jgi:hypothetical protein